MVYIRILFILFVAMYMFYAAIMFGHMMGWWQVVREKVTFGKLLIPFYYFFKM